jgi:hypothetical protein
MDQLNKLGFKKVQYGSLRAGHLPRPVACTAHRGSTTAMDVQPIQPVTVTR